MASTYSDRLRLELIGDGEQSGTWGNTTNTNLGTLIDEAIAGVITVTMADADYTLTSVNGGTDEARQAVIITSGILSAARNLICPAKEKVYIVKNSTTGGYGVTVKTSSGTGISIANGKTQIVYCDGTNVYSGIDYFASLSVAALTATTATITGGTITGITDLAVADGGTGSSTAAGARTNLGAAASGANSDITSLSGLTTALSVAQGGTGATTAADARTALSVPSTTGSGASGSWSIAVTSAAKLISTNWTVEESAGSLLFKYGGVTKFTLTSSGAITTSSTITSGGNLSVTGDITATGNITAYYGS